MEWKTNLIEFPQSRSITDTGLSCPIAMRILVFLLLILGALPARCETNPPNLVIILADDLGFSDLGCYGSRIQTPHLDQLAAEGLRYTQFYNTGRCWPTRTALMTGYYYEQVQPKSRSFRALPAYLRPRGYRSYHSGKWHVHGTRPVADAGFHHSYWLRDHDRYFSPRQHLLDDKPLPAVKPGSGFYATTGIAEQAIGFLRKHETGHPHDPFFLFVAFNAPHFPLHAKPDDIACYQELYTAGWDVEREKRNARLKELGLLDVPLTPRQPDIIPKWNFSREELTNNIGPGVATRALPWDALNEAQKQLQAAKMALHSAMIHRMDLEVGRLLAQLESMRARDNTAIFFLSDNGASAEQIIRGDRHDRNAPPGSAASYHCLGPGWSTASNTPFQLHKHWTHEGGIATPLIINWPRGISERGAIRRQPGHVIDLLPTCVSLAGGTTETLRPGNNPPPLPGLNLATTFNNDSPLARDYLYFNHSGNRALRAGNWKAVSTPYRQSRWELYDLSNDRSETRDLASAHPGRLASMITRWQHLTRQFQDDRKR